MIIGRTIRVVEDYKPLDIECASMGLALCRGIRERYPDWKFLIDGDGGDENLKDYPIEENPELTIRSVVHNQMLYHEGWGVGRSVEFAQGCGAAVVVLIPTRPGNGALEALAQEGEFSPPGLLTLERALAAGIRRGQGQVFADLWDAARFSDCPDCFPRRVQRLRQMNLEQRVPPEIRCGQCEC